MTKEYKKIAIFIDTNLLQIFWNRHKKRYTYLESMQVQKEYYQLVRFIEEHQLEEYVEICIPDVVIREFRQHMCDSFQEHCSDLSDEIGELKKAYGDLIEIDYQIKYDNKDYCKYVDKQIGEFINTPRNLCKIVYYPRNDTSIDTLLEKALKGIKPFSVQKIDGKPFKDAGFRDALIAETIYSYCKDNNKVGVLLSADGDYGDDFKNMLNDTNEYVKYTSFKDVCSSLAVYFDITTEQKLINEFTDNIYWHEFLLNSAGVEYDQSITKPSVEKVSEIEDNIYEIIICFTVNEAKYTYNVKFDSLANDIIDIEYEIDND